MTGAGNGRNFIMKLYLKEMNSQYAKIIHRMVALEIL